MRAGIAGISTANSEKCVDGYLFHFYHLSQPCHIWGGGCLPLGEQRQGLFLGYCWREQSMYSVVLMAALATTADVPACHGGGCGCHGGYYGGCYGCYGGCYGCYGGCYGCYGG